MKKVSIVLKLIIFLIIGIFILQFLNYIFVPKWIEYFDSSTARIKEYYKEKKNTIDVLAVGSSSISRGYSPITVWNNYGVTSYSLGTLNQRMSFAYYLIKESIKNQKPKAIVLDMESIFIDSDAPEGEYRKFFDNMKLGNVKLEALSDERLHVKKEDKLSYIIPTLRFHSRWNELEKEDFKFNLNEEYKQLSYKGMAMITDIIPYIDNSNYMEDKKDNSNISDNGLYYINKIKDLCKEKNIKLLFIQMPESKRIGKPYWSLAKSKKVKELADKYEIEFIDFNLTENQAKINFDWTKDSSDGGEHLNVYGAEKVSNYIGKILSEKYNIPNHKNDANIADEWNEEAQRYEQHKKELELKLEQNSKK